MNATGQLNIRSLESVAPVTTSPFDMIFLKKKKNIKKQAENKKSETYMPYKEAVSIRIHNKRVLKRMELVLDFSWIDCFKCVSGVIDVIVLLISVLSNNL